jgi:hypothetical protein
LLVREFGLEWVAGGAAFEAMLIELRRFKVKSVDRL